MNATEDTPATLLGSEFTEGLGGRLYAWWRAAPDKRNAWAMSISFLFVLASGDWVAAWFAFSAAWFAWLLAIEKAKPPNARVQPGTQAQPE